MSKHKLSAAIIMIAFIIAACSGNSKKEAKESSPVETSVVEVSIGGMSCTDCELTIQNRVGKLEGIKSVKASYTIGNAIIEYHPDKVDTTKIREAVTGSGYSVIKIITAQTEVPVK